MITNYKQPVLYISVIVIVCTALFLCPLPRAQAEEQPLRILADYPEKTFYNRGTPCEYTYDPEAAASMLLALADGTADYDLFIIRSDRALYQLREKYTTYPIDTDRSDLLPEGIRQSLTKDGHLVAVPLELVPNYWGIDQARLQALGFPPVTSFEELIDVLPALAEMKLPDDTGIMGSFGASRESILDEYMKVWIRACRYAKKKPDFHSAQFQRFITESLMKFPADMYIPYSGAKHRLFTQITCEYIEGVTCLPPTTDPALQSVNWAMGWILVPNPYSPHADRAAAFAVRYLDMYPYLELDLAAEKGTPLWDLMELGAGSPYRYDETLRALAKSYALGALSATEFTEACQQHTDAIW